MRGRQTFVQVVCLSSTGCAMSDALKIVKLCERSSYHQSKSLYYGSYLAGVVGGAAVVVVVFFLPIGLTLAR